MNYKIGLDTSGGDFAPKQLIKGALWAKKEFGQDIILIGPQKEIEKELHLNHCNLSQFEIVDAPEKILMDESPVNSIRRKKNSSIVKGAKLLKERTIDAFVSCGNTGAVTCAATLVLGLIDGVERPGIGLLIPTQKGVSLIIDVGANIDCKPMHLFQYGIMASIYSNLVLEKDNPTISLLNIGEEASKGLGVLRKVHRLFSDSNLNFIGNLEARELLSGKCDCVICDGFVGNIALKVAEGSAETVGRFFLEAMKSSFLGKIGLLLSKGNLKKFKKSIDYAEYGGALLLGVDGIVIIGHGRSNSLAVKNAIGVAIGELKRDLTGKISARINEICQDEKVKQIVSEQDI